MYLHMHAQLNGTALEEILTVCIEACSDKKLEKLDMQ